MGVDDFSRSQEMSVGVCETASYIWDAQADFVGEGSFGKVYRAVNKQSGKRVAVKTFKYASQQISQEMKMLQTLQHSYIIQFFGEEVEHHSQNRVIVTEFCNGGSLMQFLNEPENINGLVDEEFLLVVEHLSKGLEYLRRHDVIHRDVKPDNIMRHIFDDGRIIYKLADFGTARELPEGQNFTSLHGTEPYLHPQLYEACFFRGSNLGGQFGADTDLWSIGVTLYHIATGLLPFRVNDRTAMLTIYNEMRKVDGIISGVQKHNSYQVEFSKDLPQSSRLSFGLQQLVIPVIAGLFIQDEFKKWTFTRYYEEIKQLMSAKAINLFYLNKMQMLKVYINRDESFYDFQTYIEQQIEVSIENQFLLYKENLVLNLDDLPRKSCDFVALLDKMNFDVDPLINIQLNYEILSNFKNKFMNSADVRLVYLAYRDLCLCQQLIEYQSVVCDSFFYFLDNFEEFYKKQLKEQRRVHDYLLEKYASTNGRVKILRKLQSFSQSNNLNFIKDFETYTNHFDKETFKFIDKISCSRNNISWNYKCHHSYLKTVQKELRDMKMLNKKIIEGGQVSRQEYEYGKLKIVHCVTTILTILTDKMQPHFEIFVQNVKSWHKEMFSRLQSLDSLKKQLHRYKCALRKFENEIQTRSENNLKIIGEEQTTFSPKKLISLLNDYKTSNADIDLIIDENVKIMDQMENLSLSLQLDCEELI